jgi:simple sugar transport system permease protein
MKMIRSWFEKTQFYVLLILVVYSAVVSFNNPEFATLQSLFDVLRSSAVTMILALGVMMVLVSGGIDVSFAIVAVFSAYASIVFISKTGLDNLAVAFIVAIAVGALLGLVNALLIHFFRLPTFLVTLGTQSMYIGLMAVLLGTQVINTPQMPSCFVDFGTSKLIEFEQANGQIYGLSVIVIPVLIVIFLCWFIFYRTTIGRGIIAIGNSEEAANRAGYNIFRIHLFVYISVGVLSAIAGVIYVSDVAWVSPQTNNLVGGTELLTIAAVVIGGTKLTGGELSIFGTVLGVLLIRLFATTLIFLGITTSWNRLFTGVVLLGCNIVISYNRSRTRKKLLLFDE